MSMNDEYKAKEHEVLSSSGGVSETTSLLSTNAQPSAYVAPQSYESQEPLFEFPDDHERSITIDVNIFSYSVKEPRSIGEKFMDWWHTRPARLVELLHGIYATFNPGEIVCLMGSSGAGKTTLLNVLSGRAGGVLMGDVMYNGQKLPQKTMRLAMNYIPQDDILMAALTPRESLTYTARLRLKCDEEECESRVNKLMAKLGIDRCADVMIGDPMNKGISGGQRKRVSVGTELVNNPSILFVDEATTGLDSKTAEELVGILKKIANSGRTVICTIHQPSYEVFSKFDKLLLLDDGRVVYNGQVSDASNYFENLGCKVPEYVNPIEFFLKCIAERDPEPSTPMLKADDDEEEEQPKQLTDLAHKNKTIIPKNQTEWHRCWKSYSKELQYTTSDMDMRKYHKAELAREEYEDDQFDDLDYPRTSFEQFKVLLNRCVMMTLKDPKQFKARLTLVTIVAIFAGLVYLNTGKTQADTQNRLAILFQSIFFNGTNMLNNTVVLFPLERAVITREFRNGTYKMINYYLARVITAIIFQAIYVLIFASVSYWMIGLYPSAVAFFAFMGALGVLGSIAVSLGLVIGAVVPSVTLGPAVVSPLLIPLSVFSGFLVTPNQIPKFFIWLYYISFFQYTFHILVVTQFRDFEFDCCGVDGVDCNITDTDSSGTDGTDGMILPRQYRGLQGAMEFMTGQDPDYYTYSMGKHAHHDSDSTGGDDEDDYCPYGVGNVSGKVFLANQYQNDNITIPICIGALTGTLILFMVLGFIVMLWRGRQKIS